MATVYVNKLNLTNMVGDHLVDPIVHIDEPDNDFNITRWSTLAERVSKTVIVVSTVCR